MLFRSGIMRVKDLGVDAVVDHCRLAVFQERLMRYVIQPVGYGYKKESVANGCECLSLQLVIIGGVVEKQGCRIGFQI